MLEMLFKLLLCLGLYSQSYVVTEVTPENDHYLYTVESSSGYTYQFECDSEDYVTGELLSAIMYNNETPNIIDDQIVWIRSTGFYNSQN